MQADTFFSTSIRGKMGLGAVRTVLLAGGVWVHMLHGPPSLLTGGETEAGDLPPPGTPPLLVTRDVRGGAPLQRVQHDLYSAFPLGPRGQPVAGQVHQQCGVQQPVSIVVAHCAEG